MTPIDPPAAASNALSFAIKRRTQRVQIPMPITISGGTGAGAFREHTRTITVSAHGCLLMLSRAVARMQEITLLNPVTQEEVRGHIAFVGESAAIEKEIGIEFSEPSPQFWGINFPPEDWDPATRKLPTNDPPPKLRHKLSRRVISR